MTQLHSRNAVSRRLLLLTLAAAALAPRAALAAYPERPIKLLVGFPAGSAPDLIARIYAEQLGKRLGQAVVVDNRPGAGGQLAAQAAAKSAGDGYTLLLAEPGSTLVAPVAYSKITYNTERELRIVAKVSDTPFVLVTSSNGPKSLAEFTAQAKASTGRVTVGTFGAGGPQHLVGEMLAATLGFKMEPVHYRSTGDLIAGILSGDVFGTFMAPSTIVSHVQAGKMRALAITSASRISMLPDVPTFREQQVPNFDFNVWLSIFAPAGTPQAVIDHLGEALATVSKDKTVQTQIENAGSLMSVVTGAPAASFLRDETRRWANVVRVSGFKGD